MGPYQQVLAGIALGVTATVVFILIKKLVEYRRQCSWDEWERSQLIDAPPVRDAGEIAGMKALRRDDELLIMPHGGIANGQEKDE